jgi:predicted DNA-binding transcriptional regulator AlpA
MHAISTDPILSPETLAAEWGISLVTLWRTRKRDPSFPQPVRWGRKLGWRRSSVIRWLDEQEQKRAVSLQAKR